MRVTSGGLFDLAPNGVYKLLDSNRELVVSYTTFSPLPYQWRGGIFSVALSMYSYPVDYTAFYPAVLGLSSPDELTADQE